MRSSPALVLGALLALVLTQVVRLLAPGRGPYLLTLALSVAGVAGGEVGARHGPLAGPAIGSLHPVIDGVAVAALQVAALLLIEPATRRGA